MLTYVAVGCHHFDEATSAGEAAPGSAGGKGLGDLEQDPRWSALDVLDVADSSTWSQVSAPSRAAFLLSLWASGLQVSSLHRHACPTSSLKVSWPRRNSSRWSLPLASVIASANAKANLQIMTLEDFLRDYPPQRTILK